MTAEVSYFKLTAQGKLLDRKRKSIYPKNLHKNRCLDGVEGLSTMMMTPPPRARTTSMTTAPVTGLAMVPAAESSL